MTPIEVGLFVLVASTAMAIASISLWWVPVYLIAVVVVFVTPAKRQASSTVSESGVGSDADGIVALDSSLTSRLCSMARMNSVPSANWTRT